MEKNGVLLLVFLSCSLLSARILSNRMTIYDMEMEWTKEQQQQQQKTITDSSNAREEKNIKIMHNKNIVAIPL